MPPRNPPELNNGGFVRVFEIVAGEYGLPTRPPIIPFLLHLRSSSQSRKCPPSMECGIHEELRERVLVESPRIKKLIRDEELFSPQMSSCSIRPQTISFAREECLLVKESVQSFQQSRAGLGF